MDGLFSDRVIITEAEADEIFYQEVIEKIYPQSGIHFVHGQGKSNIPTIAECYQSVNVNYDIIVDFDLLRQKVDLKKYFDLMYFEIEAEKENYQKNISKFRQHLDAEAEKKFVLENIDELHSLQENIIEEKVKQYKKQFKDDVYHKRGLTYFETSEKSFNNLEDEIIKKIPDYALKYFKEKEFWEIKEDEFLKIRKSVEELVENMKLQKIHIIPCGEIEVLMKNFNIQYTKNKSKWIEISLDKISSLNTEDIKKDNILYPFIKNVLGK